MKPRTVSTFLIVAISLMSAAECRSDEPAARDKPLAGVGSPLDALDRKRIPAADLIGSLPQEVVAIAGSNRGRHSGPAKCVAVSPNGRLVASGSRDGSVRLWDPATLQETGVLPHPGDVDFVGFSDDSERLYSLCWDGNLREWNVAQEPRLSATIQLAEGRTCSLVNLASGTVVSSDKVGARTILRVRNLGGEQLQSAHADLEGFEKFEAADCLAISADGRWLAAGCSNVPNGSIYVWDLENATASPVWTISDAKRRVYSLEFTKDASLLLAGRDDGQITLWSLADKQKTQSLAGHKDDVLAMTFSPDGKHLLSGGRDGRICVWSWQDGNPRLVDTLKSHKDWIAEIAYAADGRTFYSASWDHTIRRWKAAGASYAPDGLDGHAQPVLAIAFTPDGSSMATGALSRIEPNVPNEVRVWRLGGAHPQFERALAGFTGWIRGLAYSHDGQILAAANDSGIRYWELTIGGAAGILKHKTKPYGDDYDSPGASVEFLRNRRILASGWSMPHVRLTDFTRSPPQTITSWEPPNHHIASLGISPDGTLLAAASSNLNVVDVLERDPLKPKFRLHLRATATELDRIESLVFAPDGLHIAAGARNGEVNVWKVQRDAAPDVLRGHQTVVASVSYGQGGNVLASGDWNGHVVVWDATTSKPIKIWDFPGRIWRLVFAPDGHHLAVADGTGVVYLVRLKGQ